MTNLNSVLQRAAADHGESPAVRMDGLLLSYARLYDAAGRMTSFLSSLGIGPGGRVAVMLPNVPAFPIAFYGALGAGAVVVPVNPLLKSREVAYHLRDSGATVLLAWHTVAGEAGKGAAETGARVVEVTEPALSALLDGFAPVPGGAQRAGDDTAVILYTSGTTGRPKGAELTHAGLARNAELTATTLLNAGPGDVIMGCLPLFHSFGLTCALNATITSGSTLTLVPRFDPGTALEIIGRDKVTIFESVPAMYTAMLHHPAGAQADTSSLRVCVSGGAAMPVEIMRGFEQAFGCVVLEGYGLSETSPVASFNHPDKVRKPGSIGTPIAGVQMRVVDAAGAELPAGQVGEVTIAGHNIMKGYWGKPEATAEAITGGWFRTGDLGTVDEDGYFYIVDRKKDMIIRGGFNVYPREVEEVLYEHPAVAEAAVIGIRHDELGEEVGAAVTLKPGGTATSAELRAFARERMAPYKYPRHVWLVPGLPKGPTGKILRRVVQPPRSGSPAGARPGQVLAGGTVQAMRRASTGPAGHPVVARLAAELTDELGALSEQLVTMLRKADEAYLAVDIEDLRRSVRENLASFVGDLASQRSPSTSSSRDTARLRADQGVPLGAVLHAYRLGFDVIWGALADRALRKGPEELDGLVRGSATVWAWVDTSSEAVNAEYRDALIESARKDEQQRMLLLDALFEGRLGEWKKLGGSLPVIGLPERGPYVTVSAEAPGAGIENLPGAGQFLRRRGVPSAWRLHADEQVGVVAVSRARDKDAIRKLLAEVATGRVGISPEYDDALDTGRALGIAAVARRCLPPGSTGVASIDDDWVAALVAGAPEISARVVHRLLGQVTALPADQRDILLTTLRTWLECGGNASAAARQLYCHRNTVRNRLHRLEALSGQSLPDPRGVAGLTIAAQGARLLNGV